MPQLGYWKIRGLAQPIRLLLHYVGEDFEEDLYEGGPAPDFDRSAWTSVKFTKGLDFPNLPYYIDGDAKLTQSNAILRYIARKHNLLGGTEEERIHVDIMLEQVMDFRNGFVQLCYNSDFEKRRAPYMENLRSTLKSFETFIGNRHWFAGNNVTVADFYMYEMLDQHTYLESSLLDEYPKLKAFTARFEALPAIYKYMASNEFMKTPLNNPSASFGSC